MKIIVENLATEYRDEGEGPVVLMLHGWWRDMSDFGGITEKLKQKYRIIRVDLPGFGGTEIPKGKVWNLDDYTSFVKSFIEKINIKPFVLVGHSFGGRIILKDQFEAEKIVLISAAGVKAKKWRKSLFMALAKIGDLVSYVPPLLFVRQKLKNKFYKTIGSDYLESGHMKEVFKAVVEEDLSLLASKIAIPTLLIWGKKDMVTPLEDGEKLSKLIKNSKFEIIPLTGHFSFIDKPDEVVGLIDGFVSPLNIRGD